jgi:NADP-dependent 3-hydroxy acid dehydrogenase YdfG
VPGPIGHEQRSDYDITQRVDGKVILITGGSTGIGAETARLLAARGATVAIAARRKDKLDEVVSDIRRQGDAAVAYVLDATDKARMETVVAGVVEEFERLNVLINNAGLMSMGRWPRSIPTSGMR